MYAFYALTFATAAVVAWVRSLMPVWLGRNVCTPLRKVTWPIPANIQMAQ
jgi:hypothetical protein